jgi:eukaryotic-like serine/threonine-protein kinase
VADVPERFAGWDLDSLIAVGGTAEVWLARGERGDVALKRMHTHLVRNDEARALFATEVLVASVLPRYPGVVHAVESGTVNGRPWFAMEVAPGRTLRELQGLPIAQGVAVVAAAADASAHLHGEGWVHGDINPSNLVVDVAPAAGPAVVLVDLGVARKAGAAGAVRGTHAYMAPEQVRGEAWTTATDVFALGVVLWEVVAGARLFHRGPPWLSMAAVIEHEVPPLADPRLDAIARDALAKDPAKRLASASELAARLRATAG